jgi:NADPH-dependent 2,4-dienoyl-CoA reductase/sulfur reductase-like enzyme
MRYSGLKVITEGLFGNKGWTPAWRDPAPKAEYDVVIIGGGGHGLSTAYYLAKNHGITNVAVLEKGYLGGGNVGATPPSCGRTTSCRGTASSTATR